jgi:hypothetical protein
MILGTHGSRPCRGSRVLPVLLVLLAATRSEIVEFRMLLAATRPEIVDFRVLGVPGGPNAHRKRWSRLDPENRRFPVWLLPLT